MAAAGDALLALLTAGDVLLLALAAAFADDSSDRLDKLEVLLVFEVTLGDLRISVSMEGSAGSHG